MLVVGGCKGRGGGMGGAVAVMKRIPSACIRVRGAAAAAGRVWLPEKVGGSGRIKDCRALQKRWLDGAAKSCRDGGVMLVVGGCKGGVQTESRGRQPTRTKGNQA